MKVRKEREKDEKLFYTSLILSILNFQKDYEGLTSSPRASDLLLLAASRILPFGFVCVIYLLEFYEHEC